MYNLGLPMMAEHITGFIHDGNSGRRYCVQAHCERCLGSTKVNEGERKSLVMLVLSAQSLSGKTETAC